MTKLILFVGTPGAGKSTLLGALSEKYKDIRYINLGTEMLKIAKERMGMDNREALGTMSDTEIKTQRELAFKNIIADKTDAIIDTHLTIKFGRRYVPGVTIEELKNIRISAIIYIDATAQEIWNRRHNDVSKPGRRNMGDSVLEIDEHRGVNLAILSSCAIYLSIPIYIIYNSDGKQEDAVSELENIIKEHFYTNA
jgi:adenylate kinase